MDEFKAIRLLAMKSVLNRDEEYIYREICRQMAADGNFGSVLELEGQSTEWLLTHYFEAMYTKLDRYQALKEAESLIESDEAKAKRKKAASSSMEADLALAAQLQQDQLTAAKAAQKGVETLKAFAEKFKSQMFRETKETSMVGSVPKTKSADEVTIEQVSPEELDKDWDLF